MNTHGLWKDKSNLILNDKVGNPLVLKDKQGNLIINIQGIQNCA